MYQIIKTDGLILGITEGVNYIRLASNGCNVLCGQREATGVAYQGKVYNLTGHEDWPGNDSVIVSEVDGGQEIGKASNLTGLVFVLTAESGGVDATTMAEHADAFEAWNYPIAYKEGAIRRYQGILYQCHTAHTSQETWNPVDSNLWNQIADPNEEWPAWSQPIGSHDAYGYGDPCSHNGKHWISTEDNNVWEPGVYGWSEVVEE